MSKKKGMTVLTVSAGALLSTSLLVQSFNYNNIALAIQNDLKSEKVQELIIEKADKAQKPEPSSSISLSPGLYIPEQEDLRNKQVSREDVLKTLNLEEIKQVTSKALSDLDAGIKQHLGYDASELTQTQIQLYEENVTYYSNLVQTTSADATEPQEVINVLAKFTTWVESYKTAIQEDKDRVEEKEPEVEIETVDDKPLDQKPAINAVSYEVPNLQEQYLTYEPYTAITAKTTPHYRLQTLAKTNKDGYRIYGGAIAIALGSAYGTTIGTLYDITFEDGKIMRAVLGDNKSDKHTDKLHQYRDATGTYNGKSGNIVEIIFDTTNYPTMQSVNKKINGDYPAKVKSIVKVGMAEGFGK